MTLLTFDSDKLRIRVCCGMNCSGNGGGRALESALYDALAAARVSVSWKEKKNWKKRSTQHPARQQVPLGMGMYFWKNI